MCAITVEVLSMILAIKEVQTGQVKRLLIALVIDIYEERMSIG
jgi:hypothetical protein